jgi:hypothetical protein
MPRGAANNLTTPRNAPYNARKVTTAKNVKMAA